MVVTTNGLRWLQYKARTASSIPDLSKRVMIYLLEHSERAWTGVSLTLTEGEDFTAKEVDEAARGFDTVLLDEYLKKAGTDLRFSVHYGHYAESGRFDATGQFSETGPDGIKRVRYTFWFAKCAYAKSATRLTPTAAELMAVKLED